MESTAAKITTSSTVSLMEPVTPETPQSATLNGCVALVSERTTMSGMSPVTMAMMRAWASAKACATAPVGGVPEKRTSTV